MVNTRQAHIFFAFNSLTKPSLYVRKSPMKSKGIAHRILGRFDMCLVAAGVVLVVAGLAQMLSWYLAPAHLETTIFDVLRPASDARSVPFGRIAVVNGETVAKSTVEYTLPGDLDVKLYVIEDPVKKSPFHLPVMTRDKLKQGPPVGTNRYIGRLKDINDDLAARFRGRGHAFKRPVYVDLEDVPSPDTGIFLVIAGGAVVLCALRFKTQLASFGTMLVEVLLGSQGDN